MIADHHEAIISKEDFEAVAALLERRAAEKNIVSGIGIRRGTHSRVKSSAASATAHSSAGRITKKSKVMRLGAVMSILRIKSNAP